MKVQQRKVKLLIDFLEKCQRRRLNIEKANSVKYMNSNVVDPNGKMSGVNFNRAMKLIVE